MTNQDQRLDAQGFSGLASVRYNYSEAELYENAILNGEAVLTAHGALCQSTETCWFAIARR